MKGSLDMISASSIDDKTTNNILNDFNTWRKKCDKKCKIFLEG